MKTNNIIILDENQLIGGTMSRYLKYRLGPWVKISAVADMEHCEQQLNNKSQVIVLDYMMNANYNSSQAAYIKNTLKEYHPDTDVIMISSDNDVRRDIIRSIAQMEREVSRHIIKNTRKPLTVVAAAINRAFIYPVRKFVAEHSIGEFVSLFFIMFGIMGALVVLAAFIVK